MKQLKGFSGTDADDVCNKINKWSEDTGAKVDGIPSFTAGGIGGSAVQAIVTFTGGKDKKEDDMSPEEMKNPKVAVEDEFHDKEAQEENPNPPVDPNADIPEASDAARLQLEGKPKTEATTMGDVDTEIKKQVRAEEKAKGISAEDSSIAAKIPGKTHSKKK